MLVSVRCASVHPLHDTRHTYVYLHCTTYIRANTENEQTPICLLIRSKPHEKGRRRRTSERERKRDKGRLKIVPFMKNSSHTTIALWITNIEYRWNEAYFTVTVKLTHKTIEQNYYNRHSVIFMVFRSSSFVGHRTIAANISSTICSGSISFHFFLSAFCVWFRL